MTLGPVRSVCFFFRHVWLLRLLPVLVLTVAAGSVLAADPPGRVARLNYIEGSVVSSPASDNEWIDAVLNRPLTRGDRLWADTGSRGELHIGSSALRMEGQTQVGFTALDDMAAQLTVTRGSVRVRVRDLLEGENFELDTPNLAFRAMQPGDYRIDVDPARGNTRVTVHTGSGTVYGASGQALTLRAGQQMAFSGRALSPLTADAARAPDGLDRWAIERGKREDASVSARYLPREVVGYLQLDAHGDWDSDPALGSVWYPRVALKWAPYRHGRWDWVSHWGWTWIDDAPWAFAPSHYGRWAQISTRWAWVPGQLAARPVYAPALVAFVGRNGGVDWSVQAAAGRPEGTWFPLAPGEAWRPGYRASAVYVNNVNRNMSVTDPRGGVYAHRRRADAGAVASGESRVRPQRTVARPTVPLPAPSPAPSPAPAPPAVQATAPVVQRSPGPVARVPMPPVVREQPAGPDLAQQERERRLQLARREEDERARRQLLAREQARREAWQREQQALSEQWKREHATLQERARQQQAIPNDVYAEQQQGVPARPQGVPILRQR